MLPFKLADEEDIEVALFVVTAGLLIVCAAVATGDIVSANNRAVVR